MKIAIVFGTRPEAIKMAPIIRELQRRNIAHTIIVTGQHRDMLDLTLRSLNITPHHDLNIMEPDQDLFHTTTAVLEKIKALLVQEHPDIVLVQGDTTSSFAAGLAAFYLDIPVGHVEAGLRTRDKHNPYPEEINRQLITRVADYHFAPTLQSKKNLLLEGIDEATILVTGNTVIDALLAIARSDGSFSAPPLDAIDFSKRRVVLLTAHRRENFGRPLTNILEACRRIVFENPDVELVYPVHPNPSVKEAAYKLLNNTPRVHLVEPLEYTLLIQLLGKCYLVLTDSGGLQEEAPALGKPVLVLRHTTERPEAIEAGTAKLVGTDIDAIVRETQRLLSDRNAYTTMAQKENPFGDGKAAARIVDVLVKARR